MNTYFSLVCAISISTPFVMAKPLKLLAPPVAGKMTPSTLEAVSNEVAVGMESLTVGRTQAEAEIAYREMVANPQTAKTDAQKIAAISARELFLLVDRSGSMNKNDNNPITGAPERDWNRWKSAEVAAESLSELMISLDKDNKIDIMFWEGEPTGTLKYFEQTITRCDEIQRMFAAHQPSHGSTPLHLALERVYEQKLRALLTKNEPFTVVILTDGGPDNRPAVKAFFKKIIREHHLEKEGRETLAAFTLVRMGDDPDAVAFSKEIDDNLVAKYQGELDTDGTPKVTVDIVDTKEDNFLFGTGKYKGLVGTGPLGLFWEAMFEEIE
jgi:hypothetical protein